MSVSLYRSSANEAPGDLVLMFVRQLKAFYSQQIMTHTENCK